MQTYVPPKWEYYSDLDPREIRPAVHPTFILLKKKKNCLAKNVYAVTTITYPVLSIVEYRGRIPTTLPRFGKEQ